MPDEVQPEFLTSGEAAAVLEVSVHGLRWWRKNGKLTAIQTPGGRFRWRADRVKALREELGSVPEPEGLLTSGEAAAVLGIDYRTVGCWARAGKIDFISTPGGHRRFHEAEVRALARERVMSRGRRRRR